MAYSAVLAHTVLVITAAVLFYAAWTDLKHYKIRNELIIVLIILFFIHAVVSGRWVTIYWNFAIAFLVFLLTLIFYSRKTVGGGDIKLLTVAYLWAGYTCMLPFTILLLLFAIVHAGAVKFGLVNAIGADSRRIPFAPTIAAALIGVFLIGCLEPSPAYWIWNMSSGHQQRLNQTGEGSPPQSR
jgi:prepilin peptidase CpaA